MPEAPGRQSLRFRRRDDYAVELFRGIRDRLDDVPRVQRALLELGRFYNPLIDAPIVDAGSRRRILELLEVGRFEEARRLLDERLTLYTEAEARLAAPSTEAAAGDLGEGGSGP